MTRIACVVAWSEEISDGVLRHYVALADDAAEPIGTVTVCESAEDADTLAWEWARRYRVESLADDLILD